MELPVIWIETSPAKLVLVALRICLELNLLIEAPAHLQLCLFITKSATNLILVLEMEQPIMKHCVQVRRKIDAHQAKLLHRTAV